MSKITLFEAKMKVLGHDIRGTGWGLYGIAREAVPDEITSTKVIEAKWLGCRRGDEKFWGPPDITEETTFSECIDFTIKQNGDVEFRLYNGHFFDGARQDAQCRFLVRGMHKKHLMEFVDAELEYEADRQESREEKKRRQDRREEILKYMHLHAKDIVKNDQVGKR